MVKTIHKSGPWKLTDLKDIDSNSYKVFSCFHCGGGSTMGYKLSGFEVLGGVEIDPEMSQIYVKNHSPKHEFLMGVQEFNKIPRENLPAELFDLDILDGSPPCSSFSTAGSREKAWGKNKKFREGQAVQVLDDLFFHFIETARKLQPKVVVAENVKGLVMGKAKGYVKEIAQMFNHAGYDLQLFLLNAAFMGVPQRRERTFFVAKRKGLDLPKLDLKFDETPIVFSDIDMKNSVVRPPVGKSLKGAGSWCLSKRKSEIVEWNISVNGKNTMFTQKMALPHEVLKTQISGSRYIYPGTDFFLSDQEIARGQTFPDDYNYMKSGSQYLCGMSVPPYMMNRVSKQIQLQWLDKIK